LIFLLEEYDSFTEFVNKVNFTDPEEAAAVGVYGGSIGAVIHQFFGEGDWSPTHSKWLDN
jgi:hypothetical protein